MKYSRSRNYDLLNTALACKSIGAFLKILAWLDQISQLLFIIYFPFHGHPSMRKPLQRYRTEGFGALNWAPVMPVDASIGQRIRLCSKLLLSYDEFSKMLRSFNHLKYV